MMRNMSETKIDTRADTRVSDGAGVVFYERGQGGGLVYRQGEEFAVAGGELFSAGQRYNGVARAKDCRDAQ